MVTHDNTSTNISNLTMATFKASQSKSRRVRTTPWRQAWRQGSRHWCGIWCWWYWCSLCQCWGCHMLLMLLLMLILLNNYLPMVAISASVIIQPLLCCHCCSYRLLLLLWLLKMLCYEVFHDKSKFVCVIALDGNALATIT